MPNPTLRELHRRHWQMQKTGLPQSKEQREAITAAFEERAKQLRQALPVRSTVCQTPRIAHILLLEELQVGRLKRGLETFLCGAAWPQGHTRGTLDPATCLKCLELAERLMKKD